MAGVYRTVKKTKTYIFCSNELSHVNETQPKIPHPEATDNNEKCLENTIRNQITVWMLLQISKFYANVIYILLYIKYTLKSFDNKCGKVANIRVLFELFI